MWNRQNLPNKPTVWSLSHSRVSEPPLILAFPIWRPQFRDTVKICETGPIACVTNWCSTQQVTTLCFVNTYFKLLFLLQAWWDGYINDFSSFFEFNLGPFWTFIRDLDFPDLLKSRCRHNDIKIWIWKVKIPRFNGNLGQDENLISPKKLRCSHPRSTYVGSWLFDCSDPDLLLRKSTLVTSLVFNHLQQSRYITWLSKIWIDMQKKMRFFFRRFYFTRDGCSDGFSGGESEI